MDFVLDVVVPVWGSAVAGYLIGGFPTGYLLGRLQDIDVTEMGSGRTGGTNVLRTMGLGPAALTALVDVAKGGIAVIMAQTMFPLPLAAAVAGTAAVMGHNWSVFIGFRGGAGTAPALGALLAMVPGLGVALALIVAALALVTRFASVGSLALATLAPVALTGFAALGQVGWAIAAFGWGAGALILWAHRPNISRLLRGEERRLWQPVDPSSEAGG